MNYLHLALAARPIVNDFHIVLTIKRAENVFNLVFNTWKLYMRINRNLREIKPSYNF